MDRPFHVGLARTAAESAATAYGASIVPSALPVLLFASVGRSCDRPRCRDTLSDTLTDGRNRKPADESRCVERHTRWENTTRTGRTAPVVLLICGLWVRFPPAHHFLRAVLLDGFPPFLGPRDRELPWRPRRIHPPIEPAPDLELLVPVELRLDAVDLAVVAQFTAPTRVISLAVELEQELPRVGCRGGAGGRFGLYQSSSVMGRIVADRNDRWGHRRADCAQSRPVCCAD